LRTSATSRPPTAISYVGRIAQDEAVAEAEHLAVDVQDRPALVVGDLRVLAQTEETLTDQIHFLSRRRQTTWTAACSATGYPW